MPLRGDGRDWEHLLRWPSDQAWVQVEVPRVPRDKASATMHGTCIKERLHKKGKKWESVSGPGKVADFSFNWIWNFLGNKIQIAANISTCLFFFISLQHCRVRLNTVWWWPKGLKYWISSTAPWSRCVDTCWESLEELCSCGSQTTSKSVETPPRCTRTSQSPCGIHRKVVAPSPGWLQQNNPQHSCASAQPKYDK